MCKAQHIVSLARVKDPIGSLDCRPPTSLFVVSRLSAILCKGSARQACCSATTGWAKMNWTVPPFWQYANKLQAFYFQQQGKNPNYPATKHIMLWLVSSSISHGDCLKIRNLSSLPHLFSKLFQHPRRTMWYCGPFLECVATLARGIARTQTPLRLMGTSRCLRQDTCSLFQPQDPAGFSQVPTGLEVHRPNQGFSSLPELRPIPIDLTVGYIPQLSRFVWAAIPI